MASNGTYNAGTAYVNIKPKLANFATELKTKLAMIDANHTVNVKADTTGFSAQVRAALAATPDSHNIRVNLGIDSTSVRKELENLGRDRSTSIRLDADTANFEQKMNSATRDRDVDINVNENAQKAANSIARAAKNRRMKIQVDVDTSGATRAIVQLGNRMRGLDRYQRRLILVGSGFTLLGVAAAGAIGPVSALGSAIATAAGSMATLPAILGASAAGIAGVKIGTSGVGKAFSAMGKEASGAGETSAKSMRSAERAAENAQRAIQRAQRGVRDAHEGIEEAQRRIAKAERGVADAQLESRRAQQGLNDARKEAVRDLRDMNEQLQDAALDEEGAVLAVARAKKNLQETLSDKDSDQLDVAEADLSYRRALDNLDDIRLSNTELAASVAEANRAGVEGSKVVIDAHEQVFDAQRAEADAAEDLNDAHRGLRDAYEQLGDAEQDLADAHRDLADALADLGDKAKDSAGGVDAFADALSNLSKEARDFVLAIQALGPAWKELRMAAQDALFKDLGDSVTTLANRQLPVLGEGLVGINTQINRGLRSSIAKFSTEIAAIDFKTFLQNTTGLFQGLALAAAPLSQLWIDLATVGSEYLPRMGSSIAGTFSGWSSSVSDARADGSLNAMIDNGIAAFSRLKDFAGNVGGTLIGTFRAAAEVGDPFFARMEASMRDINEWTNSLSGQNALKDFFGEASQALTQSMPVLKEIGGFLAQTLMPLVESLVTGVAPGLAEFIGQISDTLGQGEGAFFAIGDGVGEILTQFSRFLDVAEPLHGALFGIVEGVMGLPGPILAVVAAMGGLKALGALNFLKKGHDGLGKITTELNAQREAAWGNGQELGRLGGAWYALETKSSTVNKMGEAFRDASANMHYAAIEMGGVREEAKKSGQHIGAAREHVTRLGGTMKGVAAAGISGFKSALGGLTGFLGGPWGVAFMAAAAVVASMNNALNESREAKAKIAEAAYRAAEAQDTLRNAVAGTTGALSDEGLAAAAELAEVNLTNFMATGEKLSSFLGGADSIGDYYDLFTKGVTDEQEAMAELIDGYNALEEAMKGLGIPMEDVHRIIVEGGPAYDDLKQQLIGMGDGGTYALRELERVRGEVELSIDAGRRLDPAMLAVRDAIKIMSDEASTAEDKLGAMRTIMQHLGLAPKDAERAMFEAAKAIDQIAASAEAAVDKNGELGKSLFDNGRLKYDSGNAQSLFGEMTKLSDELMKVANNGGDVDAVMRDKVEPTLAALAQTFGLMPEEVEKLRTQFGLMPSTLTMIAELKGADDIEQQVKALQIGVAGAIAGEPFEIPLDLADEKAVQKLKDFGVEVEKSNDGMNWVLEVTDEDAHKRLQWWVQEGFPQIDAKNLTAKVNLDDSGFLLKVDAAKMQLAALDLSRPFPWADMDISALSAEQVAALEKVGILNNGHAQPTAGMTIDDLTEEQQIAMAQVFDLSQETPTPIAGLDTEVFDAAAAHAHQEVDKLEDEQPMMFLGINVDDFIAGIENAIRKVEEFMGWIGRAFGGDGSNPPTGASITPPTGGGPPKRAMGGTIPEHDGYRLPTSGPGTNMVDGFMGVDYQGMPIARVDAGEWVINRRASEKYHGVLQSINNGTFPTGGLNTYANGGQVEMMEAYVRQFHPGAIPTGKAYSGRRYTDNGYHSKGMAADFSNGGNAGTPEMLRLAQDIYRNHKERTLELIHYPLNGFRNVNNGNDYDYGYSTNMEHRNHVHWATGTPIALRPEVDLSTLNRMAMSLTIPPYNLKASPYSGPTIPPRGPEKPGSSPYQGPTVDQARAKYRRTKGYASGGKVTYSPSDRGPSPYGMWSLNPSTTSDITWVGGNLHRKTTVNPDADMKGKHLHGPELPGHAMGGLVEQLLGAWGKPLPQPGQIGGQGVPNMFGLDQVDLTGAEDSVQPLADFRASPDSDPNNYAYSLKSNGRSGDLPTTWGGLAVHLATPFIEGQVGDIASVLGLGSELPPAMQAYGQYQELKQGGGGTATAQKLATLSPEAAAAVGGTGVTSVTSDGKTISRDFQMDLNAASLVEQYVGQAGANQKYDPNQGAEQWRPMMIAAHDNQKVSFTPELIDAYIRQIHSESTGNPNAVQNIFDENGTGEAAGVGLLQFIPTTWASFRDQMLSNDRKDAWANLNAGVRYGQRKYGAGLINVIGNGHGWANGGFIQGIGGPTSDLIPAMLSDGEFVTRAMSTSVARPLLEAMNTNPDLAAQMNSQYLASQGAAPAATAPIELHYHIETNNVDEGMRRAEMQGRRAVRSMML